MQLGLIACLVGSRSRRRRPKAIGDSHLRIQLSLTSVGLLGLNSNQPAERSRPADRAPLKLERNVVVEIVDPCAGAGRANSRRTSGYDRDLAFYLAHRALPFCSAAVSRVHDSNTDAQVDTGAAGPEILRHGPFRRMSLRQHSCAPSAFAASRRQSAARLHVLVLP